MQKYRYEIGIQNKKCRGQVSGDIRNTFNSTDYVGNDRFVFNIKGNMYR